MPGISRGGQATALDAQDFLRPYGSVLVNGDESCIATGQISVFVLAFVWPNSFSGVTEASFRSAEQGSWRLGVFGTVVPSEMEP